MEIVSFIIGGSAFAAVLVSAIKWIIKKLTKKETATLGALGILLVISIILAALEYGFNNILNPEVRLVLTLLFTSGIAIYDVLKKAIFDGVIAKVVNHFC